MPISEKQRQILLFPYQNYDALMCDGAIRSGKTAFITIAFVGWAMENYSNKWFAICGRTVDSTIKNIIMPFLALKWATERYILEWRRTEKVLNITDAKGHKNTFEVFGGKDESSYTLIQGRTLAGVFLDEVVLQPQSFVEQALGRCSVEGARFWFSCNPSSPQHWFYKEWICKPEEHNALHLHFLLEDNPSLSQKTIERYNATFHDVFYKRYILGEWCAAEGIIYPMYENALEETYSDKIIEYAISIDYGTQNAFAALMWGMDIKCIWHVLREYRYSGRDEHRQKTDAQYLDDIIEFTKEIPSQPEGLLTIIDPSAASFIASLRQCGKFKVRKAINDVLDGIRDTATCLYEGKIKISNKCEETIKEFAGYVWDEKCETEDKPIKVNDHLMDALRYFVRTKRLIKPELQYKSVFSRRGV